MLPDPTFLLTATPRTFSAIPLGGELLIVHVPSGDLLGTTSPSDSIPPAMLEQLSAAGWTQQPITDGQDRLIQAATDRVQAIQPSADPQLTPARLLEAVLSRMNLLLPAFAQPLEWIPGCQHNRLHGQMTGRRLVCDTAQIWGWRSSVDLQVMDDEQLAAEEPDALT